MTDLPLDDQAIAVTGTVTVVRSPPLSGLQGPAGIVAVRAANVSSSGSSSSDVSAGRQAPARCTNCEPLISVHLDMNAPSRQQAHVPAAATVALAAPE